MATWSLWVVNGQAKAMGFDLGSLKNPGMSGEILQPLGLTSILSALRLDLPDLSRGKV